MIDQSQRSAIQGCTVYGRNGEKIGKAGQVYLDDQTGRHERGTVKHRRVRHLRGVRPSAGGHLQR